MAALPLGKLTILVGAGILGSVLAKEGRVSDVVSGAFKIAWKQIRRSDNTSAVNKPHNDSLMAQMNNLRKELEIIASCRLPVTVITMSRTGTSKYGIIIVVVAAGYGYFWWKGWKLPDMMFATRRSLSDASNSVAKQLESLFTSISTTQRKLSSQLDNVECSLDESIENTAKTQQEVVQLQGRTDTISRDFKKVHHAVLTLETKINRIEGKQGEITGGVWKLCDYALNMEKGINAERIQASPSSFSRPVLELPPASPSSLVTPPKSSRPALELPPASPSRGNGGILEVVESSNRGEASSELCAPEGTNNASSSSGWFGFGFPTFNSSALLRTRSATTGMVQRKR
ncbi:uncharacterized protein LOC103961501 isoform X1 [Pyrus x bretschneideri]|uniref:uncharacterized protein LOC103961501 isoform X1 n=2 Tax=Pyrus x bretschneideri TaxID=225117 RepID=UPI00202E5CBF|nr:uncharacterized protein LOC103961501 isoform X1 [Pyrus x bretschneideri]